MIFNSKLKAEILGGSITGTVNTSDGQPAAYVNIFIKELNVGIASNENGTFYLKNIKEGTYTITAAFVGLQKQLKEVIVIKGETTKVDFILTENAQRLQEVIVRAHRTPNEIPVSVGKTGIKPLDLPQSISIVGNELITNQQASRLSDVIKNVNGVSMADTRGSTSETFFARGYNLGANSIMKNGARSNSAVIPEASTLERVEVLKGSAALLYGNVSAGAVINMVTKQPKFEFGGEVSMRSGSFNFYKPTVDFYGPISKKLAFRLIGTTEDAKSFRSNVKSDRFYINPSILYKINSKTDLLVQGDYMSNNATPDFGIGSLADTILPTSISRSSFFNTHWAYNKVKQGTASATINHQLNNNWKLNFIGSYQSFNRNYFSTERIQAAANGDWERKLSRSKLNEMYLTGQLNLTGTFYTGKIIHILLVGTDADQYMNKTHAFNISTSSAVYDTINILIPNKFISRTDVPENVITARLDAPTYRLGYYVQDLITLSEKFKILAGLRWTYQKIAFTKVFDPVNGNRIANPTPSTDVNRYDKAFSPRVGLVYQPVKNTSLFASYSNNFVPNTGTNVRTGQNMEASIIDQYELGIKNDLFDGKLSANLSVYRIINSNLPKTAEFDFTGEPNSNVLNKEFAGQTKSDGAEIDLRGSITSGLNFLAGYSYNFMRFTKTTGTKYSYIVGERLVNSPAHTANATLFYTFNNKTLNGLKIGASGYYFGERSAGWNNTIGWKSPKGEYYDRIIPLNAFTTFDLSLGYSYKKLSFLAKVSNISDELNYIVHDNYSVNPIAPRQFVTTVSYKF